MTYIPSVINSGAVAITGGNIDGTTIGANNPSTAKVTSLTNSGPEIDTLRIITSGATVTQLSTDRIIVINKTNGSSTIVNLLSSPTTGLRLIIKDGKGDALLNPISVVPASGLIDGQSAIVLNVSFGAIEVCFNGTQWNVIDSVGITIQQIIAPIVITESTEGTVATMASQTIYASKNGGFTAPIAGPFNTFALTANPGQIFINGVVDTSTANVISLVYHSHRVFQNITAGNWYYWNTHSTGTSLNLIQNSTNVGAVTGSPGTLPTSWGATLSGLTQTVEGFGIDTTTGASIPYIDIRLNGTNTDTTANIYFVVTGGTLVLPSTAYTHSVYVALKSGSFTNITDKILLWNEDTAAHAYNVTQTSSSLTITSTLTQFTMTATTDPASASIQPQITLLLNTIGSSIDVTLRIAAAQLVQGSTAPTVFLPTPAPTSTWINCSTPIPTIPAINVGIQVDVLIGDAFYVFGTLQDYSSVPTLQYQDNGGTWVNFPNNASVSTTSWSFLHPSVGVPTSNFVIAVRDASTLAEGISNFFAIFTASTATINSLSLSNFTFLGSAASGTVVGTIHVNMAGGVFAGTLSLSGSNASSFAISGNNIVTNGTVPVGTYSIVVTATMTGAAGSPSSGGAILTGNTTSVVPPSQAITAGYVTPVLIDEFTSNTFGANWFSYQLASPLTTGVNITTTQAYITTSGTGTLTITTDPSSGGRLAFQTANSGAPPISTQASPVFTGQRVFQYGYFEASMKFSQTGYTGSGGWPSFWMNTGQPYPDVEIDIMEAVPSGGSGSSANIECTVHENTAVGVGVTNGTTTVTSPSIVWTNFNTYGCLWTPTSVAFYINNSLVGMTSATNPTVTGVGTSFPAAAFDVLSVMLGTGTNWTTTIDFVHIWQ